MHRLSNIILLVCIAISGCNNSKTPNGEKSPSTQNTTRHLLIADTFYLGDRLIQVETVSQSLFGTVSDKESNNSETITDTANVTRTKDTLSITTAARICRLININSDDVKASKYEYQYLDTTINQHIVLGTFYEWFYYLLIDKHTGDTTITCGIPVPSPDNKYFICGNSDLEAGETFNGFQLYKNTSPPQLISQRALEGWGPHIIKWQNENRLLVVADIFDSMNVKPIYLKLTLK